MSTSAPPRPQSDSTWWTMIDRAANGDGDARSAFVGEYMTLVRRTLGARWRGSLLAQQVEDAAQDVFLDCLKDQGALGRADPARRGGFGAFLHGVIAKVALRYERSQGRRRDKPAATGPEIVDEAPSLGAAFDQAWLHRILTLAVKQMRAEAKDVAAHERVELLSLRFGDGLAIREIAERWERDATSLHVAYARARREFHRQVHLVLRAHAPESDLASPEELDRRLRALLEA